MEQININPPATETTVEEVEQRGPDGTVTRRTVTSETPAAAGTVNVNIPAEDAAEGTVSINVPAAGSSGTRNITINT